MLHVNVYALERLLAAQNPLSHADRPHQLFADAPPTGGMPLPMPMMAPPPPPGQPVNVPPPLSGMIPPPINVPPPSCMCLAFLTSLY